MAIDFIGSIASVVVGVIIGFVLSWGTNYLHERGLRKKYSKVFSFELQQLNDNITEALQIYNEKCIQYDMGNLIDDEPEDFLERFDFNNRPEWIIFGAGRTFCKNEMALILTLNCKKRDTGSLISRKISSKNKGETEFSIMKRKFGESLR